MTPEQRAAHNKALADQMRREVKLYRCLRCGEPMPPHTPRAWLTCAPCFNRPWR